MEMFVYGKPSVYLLSISQLINLIAGIQVHAGKKRSKEVIKKIKMADYIKDGLFSRGKSFSLFWTNMREN